MAIKTAHAFCEDLLSNREPNQICPFNLAKGKIAVLLDTIGLHIPTT